MPGPQTRRAPRRTEQPACSPTCSPEHTGQQGSQEQGPRGSGLAQCSSALMFIKPHFLGGSVYIVLMMLNAEAQFHKRGEAGMRLGLPPNPNTLPRDPAPCAPAPGFQEAQLDKHRGNSLPPFIPGKTGFVRLEVCPQGHISCCCPPPPPRDQGPADRLCWAPKKMLALVPNRSFFLTVRKGKPWAGSPVSTQVDPPPAPGD